MTHILKDFKVIVFAAMCLFSNTTYADDFVFIWDTVADDRVTMYDLQWGVESGVYTGSQFVIGSETNTTNLTLTDPATYFFAARACSDEAVLCSDFSNEVSATVRPRIPAPGNFTLIMISTGK